LPQSVAFFGLKMIQNTLPASTTACISSILSGKFVTMLLIPVVLVDFRGKFKHLFASLRHICTHKEGVSASISYIVCEVAGGGDL